MQNVLFFTCTPCTVPIQMNSKVNEATKRSLSSYSGVCSQRVREASWCTGRSARERLNSSGLASHGRGDPRGVGHRPPHAAFRTTSPYCLGGMGQGEWERGRRKERGRGQKESERVILLNFSSTITMVLFCLVFHAFSPFSSLLIFESRFYTN